MEQISGDLLRRAHYMLDLLCNTRDALSQHYFFGEITAYLSLVGDAERWRTFWRLLVGRVDTCPYMSTTILQFLEESGIRHEVEMDKAIDDLLDETWRKAARSWEEERVDFSFRGYTLSAHQADLN